MLRRSDMAIMATQSATSTKKPGSHESHGERDAKRARPNEAHPTRNDKGAQKPPAEAETDTETEDDTLDNPYDNVACTD